MSAAAEHSCCSLVVGPCDCDWDEEGEGCGIGAAAADEVEVEVEMVGYLYAHFHRVYCMHLQEAERLRSEEMQSSMCSGSCHTEKWCKARQAVK